MNMPLWAPHIPRTTPLKGISLEAFHHTGSQAALPQSHRDLLERTRFHSFSFLSGSSVAILSSRRCKHQLHKKWRLRKAARAAQPSEIKVAEHALAWDGNIVKCTCGARCGSQMVWALHVEQEVSRPLGASGWSLVAEATVPGVRLAQPAVISKNCFSKGYSLIIWLPEQIANKEDTALRAATAVFLGCMEEKKQKGAVGLLGFSDRVLTLLGAQRDPSSVGLLPTFSTQGDGPRCPEFTPRLHCDTKEVIMPATGGDLLAWVKSEDEAVFDEVRSEVLKALGEAAVKVEAVRCKDLSGRDLTGFKDGTNNFDVSLRPVAEKALQKDGGSVIFAARFAHNMAGFRKLNKEAQSRIFSRDIRVEQPARGLDGRDENPRIANGDPQAHVARAWGGMYRQAMPYLKGSADALGAAEDQGSMFVAAIADPKDIKNSLARMAGEFNDGIRDTGVDHLFKITNVRSGAYFYAPPLAELAEEIAGLPPAVIKPLGEGVAGINTGGINIDFTGRNVKSLVFHCPNCAENAASFQLLPNSDFARCYNCKRLYLQAKQEPKAA